jgi:signal transduction histidine kinase
MPRMSIEPASVGADTAAAPPAQVLVPGPDPRRLEMDQWRRRRGLERELHDGPAQHISALVVKLGLIRHLVDQLDRHVPGRDDDPASPHRRLHFLLMEFAAEVADTLGQLRRISAALYPPLLHQAGLGAALREAFLAQGVPARVRGSDVRFDVAVEGAAYFAVMACLAVGPEPALHEVVVSDDTQPGARAVLLDLVGVGARQAEAMMEQVCQMGGQVLVATQAGTPNTARIRIPCP